MTRKNNQRPKSGSLKKVEKTDAANVRAVVEGQAQKIAEEAMADIQHFISSQQRSVKVSKDEASGYMVVQLVDPASGEVIRTLPSEELLRIARTFEMLGSVMVNQRA